MQPNASIDFILHVYFRVHHQEKPWQKLMAPSLMASYGLSRCWASAALHNPFIWGSSLKQLHLHKCLLLSSHWVKPKPYSINPSCLQSQSHSGRPLHVIFQTLLKACWTVLTLYWTTASMHWLWRNTSQKILLQLCWSLNKHSWFFSPSSPASIPPLKYVRFHF